MRILTFTSLFPNSLDRNFGIFVYQRSKHLAARDGNEVAAVSPVPYLPRWLKSGRWATAGAMPAVEQINGLTIYHPRYFLLPKIWMPFHALTMFLGSLSLVKKLHREKAFDCIDAHFVYPDGMAAVLLGRTLEIPVIVSARGSDITQFSRFWSIRPMVRWTLKRAAAVIAVSESLKEEMVSLGVNADKVRVIPNGIDSEQFRRIGREEARRRLKLPLDNSLLVSVGALVPAKDHRLLIESFGRIAKTNPALRLHILGEGFLRPQLERLVRDLGLGDQVSLPGKRPNDELPLWFSAAEISCLSSEREGWPNVVTESLACGTPVVATGVGGVREILHSAELGIVTERSVEGFAAGICEALKRTWDRNEISRQTRGRAWRVVAEEVAKVLGEQVRLHGGGS